MKEEIIELAKAICGAGADFDSWLALLCTAVMGAMEIRLKENITAESCRNAFVCACAYIVAADFIGGGSGTACGSFTAGDVSVNSSAGDCKSRADTLRAMAQDLMRPYAKDNDFAFVGVQV